MTRAHLSYSNPETRAGDTATGLSVETPVAGYYRMRLRSGSVLVGVRIWHGPPADPVTGTVLDRSWRWQAEVNGEYFDDFDRVWPVCARGPITEAEYQQYCRMQHWARENAPDTAHADPRRKRNLLTDPLPI